MDLGFLQPQERRTVGMALAALACICAGFALHGLFAPAEAAAPSRIEQRLDKLDRDILLIKCRLGIEGVCPQETPAVHTSAVGH